MKKERLLELAGVIEEGVSHSVVGSNLARDVIKRAKNMVTRKEYANDKHKVAEHIRSIIVELIDAIEDSGYDLNLG